MQNFFTNTFVKKFVLVFFLFISLFSGWINDLPSARGSEINNVVIGSPSTEQNPSECRVLRMQWDVKFEIDRKSNMNLDANIYNGTINLKLEDHPTLNISFSVSKQNTDWQKLITLCNTTFTENKGWFKLRVWLYVGAGELFGNQDAATWFESEFKPVVLNKALGRYGGSIKFPPINEAANEVYSAISTNNQYENLVLGALLCGNDCATPSQTLNLLNETWSGGNAGGDIIGFIFAHDTALDNYMESVGQTRDAYYGEQQLSEKLPLMPILHTRTDLSKSLDQIDIKINIRDKYRVSLDQDAQNFTFDFGDTVSADWKPDKGLTIDQEFNLPAIDNTTGYNQTPNYKATTFGVNYAQNIPVGVKCEVGTFWDACQDVFFGTSNGYAGKWSEYGEESPLYAIPSEPIKVKIKNVAWTKQEYYDKNVENLPEGAVGQITLKMIPVIWGHTAAGSNVAGLGTNRNLAYLLDKSNAVVRVEIFQTDKQVQDACEKEKPEGVDCTDYNQRRYKIGKEIEVGATGTGREDKGLVQSLLDFVRKVVGALVAILNSIIYKLFAFIVVPIISALLSVKPWKDSFVEVIYPGWLIVRNLANIAFIVSLLVVGLRVLFQVEEAAKSRTFIKDLILMALLVNFSLVIAQGAVAIADTVQSQFLPANSKVIEAIGWKLMVDPIETFNSRFESGGDGNINIDASSTDIFFPIVLLFLAIASLFAFMAIAGFIFIRLCALWVLYMVSPVAYFGAVIGSAFGSALPQAADISKQWWSQFLRYALTVPILAFFLNMTALMAVVFSNHTGPAVEVLGDSEHTLMQAGADALVSFALTIMTHFIVLLFLVIGMKYAQQSGTIGAKGLVDFAEKGAKGTMKAIGTTAKTLGMGGKNLVGNAASSLLEKAGFSKAAGVTQALFRPKMAYDQAKEKAQDLYKKNIVKPREQMDRAAQRRIGGIFGNEQKPHKSEWQDSEEKNKWSGKEDHELQEALAKAYKEGNDIDVGAITKEMTKRGNMNDVINQMKQIAITEAKAKGKSDAEVEQIGKSFTNDDKGMQLAMEQMVKGTKMSTADVNELQKNVRSSAKRHGKDEYLDTGLSEATRDTNQAQRQMDKQKKGVLALHNGSVSNQVTRGDDGRINGLEERHLKTMAQMDTSALADAGVMSQFRQHENYQAWKTGWNSGGREAFIEALKDPDLKLSEQDKQARVQAYDSAAFYGAGGSVPQQGAYAEGGGGETSATESKFSAAQRSALEQLGGGSSTPSEVPNNQPPTLPPHND